MTVHLICAWTEPRMIIIIIPNKNRIQSESKQTCKISFPQEKTQTFKAIRDKDLFIYECDCKSHKLSLNISGVWILENNFQI